MNFLPVTFKKQHFLLDKTTGCWVWQLALDHDGYGKYAGQKASVIYFKEIGRNVIPSGFVLDHLCRNRKCVNPEHLEPVSSAENSRRGMNTKLNKLNINFIRKFCADGGSQSEIARKFNVTPSQINHIIHFRSWVNV